MNVPKKMTQTVGSLPRQIVSAVLFNQIISLNHFLIWEI